MSNREISESRSIVWTSIEELVPLFDKFIVTIIN